MATTFDILKAESKRLRALADKLDMFAAEIQNETQSSIEDPMRPPAPPVYPSLPGVGEFTHMNQVEAIQHALNKYGPQTTAELFSRLNAGGMTFKKISYVTSVLARFKDKWERLPDKKISLKPGI